MNACEFGVATMWGNMWMQHVRIVGGCCDDVRQYMDAGESVATVMWVSEKSTTKSKYDGSRGITGCAQDDNEIFFSDLNLDCSLYIELSGLEDIEDP